MLSPEYIEYLIVSLIAALEAWVHNIFTHLWNNAWAIMTQFVVGISSALPLPLHDVIAGDENIPLAMEVWYHILLWMRLLSYFINTPLLVGCVFIVFVAEAALYLPRWWIFVKRMIPFL